MAGLRRKKYQLNGSNIYLKESSELVILRTYDNCHPGTILSTALLSQYVNHDHIVDEYPEASAWVYKLSLDCPYNIGEIKSKVRALEHPKLAFIGSVMVDEISNRYQLYTGNLFIQFNSSHTLEDCRQCLQNWQFKEKSKLNFADNCYFIKPDPSSNLDAFDWAEKLSQYPEVAFCQPELVVNRKSFYCDHKQIDCQLDTDRKWIEQKVELDKAWENSTGKGVKICIIDDGIDPQHPAFNNKIIAAKDMFDDKNILAEHKFGSEYHGTACASIACSSDPNASGVAPDAQLIVVRSKGLGSVLEAQAIYWAVEQGADIISCSWGPSDGDIDDPSDDFPSHRVPEHTRLALHYAATKGRNGKGCLVVFAAGNGSEAVSLDSYASNPCVIAVGSVNKDNQLTKYSDYGEPLFCVYPSSEITKIVDGYKTKYGVTVADRLGEPGYTEDDYYSLFGGTSASAPAVAGVAALALSVNPFLTVSELKNILQQSCIKVGDKQFYDSSGYSHCYGWGMLNAAQVVQNTISNSHQQFSNDHKEINIMTNSAKGYALHIGVNVTDPKVYKNFSKLSGCVRDAQALQKITLGEGFETTLIKDRQATRQQIKDHIRQLASKSQPGDLVVITYAGHGSFVNNEVGDEPTDEVLVTYDGFLIDDEIHQLFTAFQSGVRVLWISDCCHAKSNTRMAGRAAYQLEGVRMLDPQLVTEVFEKNRSEYEATQQRSVKSKTIEQLKASILCMHACQEDEYAKEISGRGLFTQQVERAYYSGNVITPDEVTDHIIRPIGVNQNPSIEYYGGNKELFNNGVFKVQQSSLTNPETSQELNTQTFEPEKTTIIVETKNGSDVTLEGTGSRSMRVVDSELQVNISAYVKPWDAAYQTLFEIENQDEIEFLEPDIISDIYSVSEGSSESRSENDSRGFLKTYPNAYIKGNRYEVDHPFIWQLDKRYSQLRPAFDRVREHLDIDKLTDAQKQELPLICHIDTGIVQGHDALPEFFESEKSRTIGSFKNKNEFQDKKSKFAPVENQDHGLGTICILAGGKIGVKDEDAGGVFNGYYGAFPYARVMTVKISESVVLLSGHRFSKAVDHAIKEGADVISMSMAGVPTRAMLKAVNRAYEAGIVIVSAAGNNWTTGGKRFLPKKTMYPARFGRVIGVTGATLQNKPYLVNESADWAATRDVGRINMQTCYGPESASKTNIAAYTPNVQWASTGSKLFDKSGGGTSSAAPQVAAAAAMWLYHHRNELKKMLGDRKDWRRAELARQALFQSADKSQTQYNHVFGNGLLKANDALDITPKELMADLGETTKDKLGWFILDNIISQLANRGSNHKPQENEELIKDMMQTELAQLCYLDPLFYDFDEDADLEQLVSTIVQSEIASNALKNFVKDNYSIPMPASDLSLGAQEMDAYIAHKVPTDTQNEYHIRAEGCGFQLVEKPKNKCDDEVHAEYVLTVVPSQTRGGTTPSLQITNNGKDNKCPALITQMNEETGEETLRWVIPNGAAMSRGGVDDNAFHMDIDMPEGQRGILSGVRRFILKVYRTVKDEALSGQSGLIIGKIDNGKFDWQARDKASEAAIKKQKKVLLFLHGTFSSAEVAFSDVFSNSNVLKKIQKQYGDQVLAFNMSTIRSKVTKNAKDLDSELTKLLGKNYASKIAVIAHSRGCLVARSTFDVSVPMALVAGTHNGTPLADGEHISSYLNRITNLASVTFGPSVFSGFLLGMSRVVRWVGKADGIEDQAPLSSLIKKLAKEELTDKQLLIAADFEPVARVSRQLADESVDRVIFSNAPNDGVTPKESALAEGQENAKRYAYPLNDINHFEFFANEKVLKKIMDHLS